VADVLAPRERRVIHPLIKVNGNSDLELDRLVSDQAQSTRLKKTWLFAARSLGVIRS